jgi:plastocyanin
MSLKKLPAKNVLIVIGIALLLGGVLYRQRVQSQQTQSVNSLAEPVTEEELAHDYSEAAGELSVTIEDSQFNPDTITIKAGTVVNWHNEESTTHTATANDNSFDTGPIVPESIIGASFNTPGEFTYYSKTNSKMKGKIIVEERSEE